MKKLTKSATDRQVSGVLGGISEYFGIDSTIVRVIFLISVFAGVGSPVLLYILMAVLMPEPGRSDSGQSFGGNVRVFIFPPQFRCFKTCKRSKTSGQTRRGRLE